MANTTEEQLLIKVEELEGELTARREDLANYRAELKNANVQLEGMIAQTNRDVRSLSRLQKSLVPTSFPHIQGFEFSTKFIASHVSGGDYLDIFEHQDRMRFSLLLSSASGYSLSALMLGSLLGLSGELDAKTSNAPHLVVESIIKEILKDVSEEEQGELFFALINRRNLELKYSLSGQIHGFHYKNRGRGELVALEPTSPPINMGFDVTSLSSKTIPLNSNDLVILCSRGLVEATNLAGEEFGVERLVKTLMSSPKEGVHDIRNEIFFQVQKHSGGTEVPRDQSVIVMSVKDRSLKLAN